MLPPSAPASAAKRPTPGAPTAIPTASDGGKAAKKTVRTLLFDVWSLQARTHRLPKHYTKWSFDIRAPPKCRLCSQRSEHGSSLVSLTGSTWRQEDVVLLEPFWAVLKLDRYHVSGQSNTLMAHQPKQSKSGIDRYSIPLWPGGGNGA